MTDSVSPVSAGVLHLVATPLGNLGDISQRAIRVLGEADMIACEDSRRTGQLLSLLGIASPRLVVVNDHTEIAASDVVRAALDAGDVVALVSDAGTPAISDPGERLVRAVIESGGEVSPVPGPSSPIAGLIASGLPTGRFTMEGFLPRKGVARAARMTELATERRTIVLLEAPHRLAATLSALAAALGGERRAVVARELTKLHETFHRGTLDELAAEFGEGARGEIVLVIDGAAAPDGPDDAAIVEALRLELEGGSSRRDAVAAISEMFGVGRNRVYDLAVTESAPVDD